MPARGWGLNREAFGPYEKTMLSFFGSLYRGDGCCCGVFNASFIASISFKIFFTSTCMIATSVANFDDRESSSSETSASCANNFAGSLPLCIGFILL